MDAVIFPLIKKLRTYEAALRTIHAQYHDSVGEMAAVSNGTLMLALRHLVNEYQEVKKTSENVILSITMEVVPSPGVVTVSPNTAPVLVGKDVLHGPEKHSGELSVDETGAVEQNEAAHEEIVQSIQDLDITGTKSIKAAENNMGVFALAERDRDNTDVFHRPVKPNGELSEAESVVVENEAAREKIMECIQDLDHTGGEPREAAEDNNDVFHGPEKHNGELNEADTGVVKKLQDAVEMLMECLEDLDFTVAESREAEQNNIAVPAERNMENTICQSLTTASK